MREAHGCDSENPSMGFSFDPSLKRCPFAVITPDSFHLLDMWSLHKAKMLKKVEKYPATVTEAITVCNRELGKYQEEMRKRGNNE